ncbi:MAG TPA: FtsX-like permease family protein [Polyangiaceae bacterium]|nr:FtsX-like permease family protein [Polyangiaceae bacterium]
MEFGPIVRAMLRNKVRFGLIVAEIALTLAVVTNCVALILHARGEMSRPSGFDDEALVRVDARQLDTSYRDEGRLDEARRRDVEALRATPGVRSVMNTNFLPWTGGGSSTEVKPLGAPTMLRTQVYATDASVSATLGVALEAGREFTAADAERDAERLRALNATRRERDAAGKVGAADRYLQDVVVSRALAELAFGPGPHLGQLLEDSDGDHYQIVGVIDRFYNPYGWPIHEYVMFYANHVRSYEGGAAFLVRAEPGRAAAVARAIEERLRRPGEAREIQVRLITDVRDKFFGPQRLVSMLMGSVVVLLLAVTAFGVGGLTSFSVTERTRQIGTRRALGATTGAVLRYFLLENWLLTTAGLALGGALAVGLNVLLVSTVAGAKLHAGVVALGMAALWAAGLGAALLPARRAARTSPAVATRNV